MDSILASDNSGDHKGEKLKNV